MAKAIRKVEFSTSGCRTWRIDVEDIHSVDVNRGEKNGRTVVVLKNGKKLYSKESVFDISKAITEAKGNG